MVFANQITYVYALLKNVVNNIIITVIHGSLLLVNYGVLIKNKHRNLHKKITQSSIPVNCIDTPMYNHST